MPNIYRSPHIYYPKTQHINPAVQLQGTIESMSKAETADQIETVWNNRPDRLRTIEPSHLTRFATATEEAMMRAGLDVWQDDDRLALLMKGVRKLTDPAGETFRSCKGNPHPDPPKIAYRSFTDRRPDETSGNVPYVGRPFPSRAVVRPRVINLTGALMISGVNQVLGGRIFGQEKLELHEQVPVESVDPDTKAAESLLKAAQQFTNDETFIIETNISDSGQHSYAAAREVVAGERSFAPDLWGIRVFYHQNPSGRSASVSVPTGRLYGPEARDIMARQNSVPELDVWRSPTAKALAPHDWLPEYTSLQIVDDDEMPAGVQYETYSGLVSRTLASIKAQTE